MSHRLTPHVFTSLLSIILGCTALAADESPKPALPQIPQAEFKITDFGATPNDDTLDTAAITKAIDACRAKGGGVVIVPAGKFISGAITLVSKMELRLDEGATLMLTDAADAFPISESHHQHAISAERCTDVAITGNGTIDGNGKRWWDEFLKVKGKPEQNQQPRRPNLIDLGSCQRVLVRDVLIKDSPNFHLVPRDCDDVTIDSVRIKAPDTAPNTDGIDPSGRNYLITKCTIDVGDDNIAFKPQRDRKDGRPSCENIVVSDCTFKHGHGLSIGGQTPAGMRNLVARDCTFDGTDAGIRMKAPRGEGGVCENLVYENLTMRNVKVPIFITSYYPNNTTPKEPGKDSPKAVNEKTPIWRNIRISNVTIESCPEAGRIFGLPEMPVSDLTLTNVTIKADKGLRLANAKNVTFKDSPITAAKGPAIFVDNAEVSGIDPATGKPQ